MKKLIFVGILVLICGVVLSLWLVDARCACSPYSTLVFTSILKLPGYLYHPEYSEDSCANFGCGIALMPVFVEVYAAGVILILFAIIKGKKMKT